MPEFRLSEEEIKAIATEIARQLKDRTTEPMPRSEIMEELKIKDIRTFKKRAQKEGAISCGKIGKQPAYYLKDFRKLVA